MYIPREVEATIGWEMTQGKVVLVTGARQVGKTTTLRHLLGDRYNYVSLENPLAYQLAKTDSVLFFSQNALPLIVDEIQRVPELFSAVKWQVDESNARGQVVLTGSQTYHLMKGVSESLAGRIRVIDMPPLSLREILVGAAGAADSVNAVSPVGSQGSPGGISVSCKGFGSGGFVPTLLGAGDKTSGTGRFKPEGFDLWQTIHRGSMPELQDSSMDWDGFYTNYVAAYLERDVRELLSVKDEVKFYEFMVACAARSGSLFNASAVGGEVGVNYKTVQSWLSVLQASNIVRIVRPFSGGAGRGLGKTPKLFFMDTGLVCHLTRWASAETLRHGAAAGHVFETFVVSEILKSYLNAGSGIRDVWFYRDSRKREIDLVIQRDRVLHPVEVKTAGLVRADAVKNFQALAGFDGFELGTGAVVCQTPQPYLVTENVQAIPVWEI